MTSMAADPNAGAYTMRQSALALIVYCQCKIPESNTTTNLGNSGGIDGDAVEGAKIDDCAAILTTEAEGGAVQRVCVSSTRIPYNWRPRGRLSDCPHPQRTRKPKKRVGYSLL